MLFKIEVFLLFVSYLSILNTTCTKKHVYITHFSTPFISQNSYFSALFGNEGDHSFTFSDINTYKKYFIRHK